MVATSQDDGANRDADSVLGALNLIRDLIGYAILPYNSVSEPVLTTTNNYKSIISKIYYKDNGDKREYYYFMLKEGTNEYYLQ